MFTKPQRTINRVFIHCSASDHTHHDDVSVMDKWHKARGWRGVGYHYFIKKDGTVQMGRSIEETPAAQRGHNAKTVAICLHGLLINKFTIHQEIELHRLCQEIDRAYHGQVTFHGHCEVSAKSCPVIDYRRILQLDHLGHFCKRKNMIEVKI